MFIYLGYRDIVFNEIKLFLDIQEYGTIQFTIIHSFRPFITHLGEDHYCRVIWAESKLKF